MSKVLYADGNDNTVIVSPVLFWDDNSVQSSVVFSVTLYDSNSDPISGATALETVFHPDLGVNYVTIPGSVPIAPGRYTMDAAAIDAWATKIKFTATPIVARYRTG